MKEQYELYYNKTLIGILTVNNDKYFYEVSDKINQVLDQIFDFLKTNQCSDSFPFFKKRIEDMKKFNLTELKYQTDNYKLIKKSDE